MAKNQKSIREEDSAYRPYKRDEKEKRKRRLSGKLNSFTWSPAEQSLYVEFLKNHKNLFVNIEERKKNKVFVQMNIFIKKRGPDQCRSHHQKMSIKCGSIDLIIQRLTEEKFLKGKHLQCQENSIEIESQQQNFTYEKITQNQDRPQQKTQEIPILDTSQTFFDEEGQLWDYLDKNFWINQ